MSWPKVPLAEVATIDRFGIDPAEMEADTAYLGLEHIARGGEILGAQAAGEAALASTKFRFTREHILFGKLRPNLGKVALPDFDGICSTDILPIRPGPKLYRSYLRYYLAQPSMIDFAASRAAGANLPRLSPSVLATFPIPLPPLNEQRRIAAILDQADALRAKRRQTLAHLDDLTQSIFLDMFGDPASNPMGWSRVSLGEVVPVIDSGKSPNCEARPAGPDEWGVLKLGAVTYGVFEESQNKAYLGEHPDAASNEVRPGDLLFTRKNTGQLVGAAALVREVRPRLLIPDLIFRLQVDESRVLKPYLQTLLMNPRKRPEIRSLASGSAASMPNISKARLNRLPIEVPPLEAQADFAVRIEAVRDGRQVARGQASAMETLFTSLQSRAFSGQL